MAGSLIKQLIGKEDLAIQTSPTDLTYSRLNSVGSVITMTKIPDIWDKLSINDLITKSPWVDVRAYGVVGNGVADDSTAFNNATTYLNSLGGGMLLVPKPSVSYHFLSSVLIKSNISIIGLGIWPKITTPTTVAAFNAYSADNWLMENLWLEGPNDGTGYGIHQISGNSPTIRKCRFRYYGMGIYGWPGNDVKIDNNYFYSNNYGIYSNYNFNWKIINNTFEGNHFYPIYAANPRGFVIDGNYINGNEALTMVGILIPITNAIDGLGPPSDNKIINNTIWNIKEEGISFDEIVASAFLTGGTATSGGAATLTDNIKTWTVNAYSSGASNPNYPYSGHFDIILVAGTGAGQWRTITSNTIDTITVDRNWRTNPDLTTKYTILKASKKNIIANNSLYNVGNNGIMVYGPSIENVIANNTLRKCGINHFDAYQNVGIGIVATRGQGVTPLLSRHPAIGNVISGNTITESHAAGIGLLLYDWGVAGLDFWNMYNVINGNKISDADAGIEVQKSKYTSVSGNTISHVTDGIVESDDANYNSINNNVISDYSGNKTTVIGAQTVESNNQF